MTRFFSLRAFCKILALGKNAILSNFAPLPLALLDLSMVLRAGLWPLRGGQTCSKSSFFPRARVLQKALLFCLLLLVTSCAKQGNGLKIAATSRPHAEMLQAIEQDLAQAGIHLEILVIDEYNIPNRALADGEVDANFFQHQPYLAYQAKMFHYPITSFAKIHVEPMGVYSKKITKLEDLKQKAIISLPNDPTNEARALALLHKSGIITLDDPDNLQATILNIASNPKEITFVEMDAAMLPRTLQDVDASIITTNFALQADLAPTKDALVREDSSSHYVNIIAIRKGDENRPELIALKKAMTSEKMRHFIRDKYKGALLEAF